MIKQGQSTIEELGTTLRALGPIDQRLPIRWAPEGLSVVTGVVNAGEDLSGVAERTYACGDVLFIKAVVDGDDLASWLTGKNGKPIPCSCALAPEPISNLSIRPVSIIIRTTCWDAPSGGLASIAVVIVTPRARPTT